MPQIFRWYSTVNAAMLYHLTNQIKETDNSGVWRCCFVRRSLKKFKFCLASRFLALQQFYKLFQGYLIIYLTF